MTIQTNDCGHKQNLHKENMALTNFLVPAFAFDRPEAFRQEVREAGHIAMRGTGFEGTRYCNNNRIQQQAAPFSTDVLTLPARMYFRLADGHGWRHETLTPQNCRPPQGSRHVALTFSGKRTFNLPIDHSDPDENSTLGKLACVWRDCYAAWARMDDEDLDETTQATMEFNDVASKQRECHALRKGRGVIFASTRHARLNPHEYVCATINTYIARIEFEILDRREGRDHVLRYRVDQVEACGDHDMLVEPAIAAHGPWRALVEQARNGFFTHCHYASPELEQRYVLAVGEAKNMQIYTPPARGRTGR